MNERSQFNGGRLAAAVVLGLALVGPMVGNGWVGHGLYKCGLLLLPFLAGAVWTRPTRWSTDDLWKSIGSGVALGGTAAIALLVILPKVADPAAIRNALDLRYGLTPMTAVITAGLILSVNALLEEWFYRGFLDRRIGMIPANFVFGAQHTIVLWGIAGAPGATLAGLAVIPAGIIWSLIARNGIARPFVSHALTDLILFSAGLWLLGYFG